MTAGALCTASMKEKRFSRCFRVKPSFEVWKIRQGPQCKKNDFLYFYTNRNILQNESYCFVLWIYLKISRRYLTSRYTTIASNTALRYLWKGSNFPESQVFLIDRVEICRDRHDRKICASCVNFPRKQCNFSHYLRRATKFTHAECDFALKLLKFYTFS